MKHGIFLSRCFPEDSTLWFPSRRQQEPQRWARRQHLQRFEGGKRAGKIPSRRAAGRQTSKGSLSACLVAFVLLFLSFYVFFLSFLKWTASSSLSDSGRLGLLPVQKAYARRRSVQIWVSDSSSCSRNISRARFSFSNPSTHKQSTDFGDFSDPLAPSPILLLVKEFK